MADLLQSLSEKLESYDEGLRRYPVVYYFHTRRTGRHPALGVTAG